MIFLTSLTWIGISIILKGVWCTTPRDTLKTALFTGYDADIRPYCGNDDAIAVSLDVAMRQLIDLNEPLQIIKANIWIRMIWIDCRLVWNASDHAGIDNIVVPYSTLWIPDITLYDNTGETFFGKEDFTPNIYSDGTVYYNFPSVVDNRCIVDVSHFPYDSQECKFVFGSWAYNGNEVNFTAKNSNGDLSSLEANAEWDVTSFPAIRHVLYYKCCPEPYPDVTFYLKMTRKPKFYVINLILPSVLITVMGLFGFLLPCEAGEKVALEITVMLSLAVFQILVADSLPPSAETIPLIAIYFDFTLFLVGYATVIAVLVNNLHHRDNGDIPRPVRRIFFDYLARVACIKAPKTFSIDTFSSEKEQIENNNHTKEYKTLKRNGFLPPLSSTNTITVVKNAQEDIDTSTETEEHLDKIEKTLEHIDSRFSRAEEWKLLAMIVDRIACFIYIFVGVIGVIVLFGMLGS